MKHIQTFESYLNENSEAKITAAEFGDDPTFLSIVWHYSKTELEDLLKTSESDIKWLKANGPKGKIMGSFTRRNLSIIESRIKFLKQIIDSKKKNPEFVPDQYKSA